MINTLLASGPVMISCRAFTCSDLQTMLKCIIILIRKHIIFHNDPLAGLFQLNVLFSVVFYLVGELVCMLAA